METILATVRIPHKGVFRLGILGHHGAIEIGIIIIIIILANHLSSIDNLTRTTERQNT